MHINDLETQIEEGNLDSVKSILTQHPTLARQETSYHVSPLLLACYYKKTEIAAAIANFVTELTLFEACAIGKFDVATYLIAQNPNSINDYSNDGFTPLGLATFFAHEDLTRFLILKGAEVNLPSNNGFNVFPIHSAVATRNLNITQTLLENGANANVRQQASISPLHTAAQNGDIEIIIALLQHGAEVDIRMEGGKLAADLAEEKGFKEIAEILKP